MTNLRQMWLNDNDLNGPHWIHMLQCKQPLNMLNSCNACLGCIPCEIGELRRLEVVALHSNSLRGKCLPLATCSFGYIGATEHLLDRSHPNNDRQPVSTFESLFAWQPPHWHVASFRAATPPVRRLTRHVVFLDRSNPD